MAERQAGRWVLICVKMTVLASEGVKSCDRNNYQLVIKVETTL